MSAPLEHVLSQVARKGSWYGGGTAAALGLSLSAALLEKLAHRADDQRRLRALRHLGLRLAEQDAQAFARVIAASRHGSAGKSKALKQAIDIPCQVYESATRVRAIGRRIARTIKPRFQSDVRCALALAQASAQGAQGFINANLMWLNDRRYASLIRQKLGVPRG